MMNKTRLCLLAALVSSVVGIDSLVFASEDNNKSERKYLELGTENSQFGGENIQDYDRAQISNQIRSFIPPLLAPAVVQHAYVLPPKTFRMDVAQRFLSIDGDDFFKDGEENLAVFEDFEVDRNLTDVDFFYGFDLDNEYLHGFTLRVNIPYYKSQTDGFVHPHGQPFISLENAGSTQDIGDVGIFLKKKILDQGNHPFGLAMVGAVFLPTGSNHEKFGSNGRITAKRPQPPNTIVAQGFDALQRHNVETGIWGDPRCFFINFNLANRSLCNDNPTFSASAAGVMSFAPGGENYENAYVGDFPFNNGVFGRFAGDGRLPSVLQPGTGTTSFLLGAFATRQFGVNSPVGRAAFHAGVAHKFVSEDDGVDFGDTTTIFASFVKPVYKDFLSADLTFVGFNHEDDHYDGKIPEPGIHHCEEQDIGVVGNCSAVGDEAFVFELVDRPAFSGGFTGFLAPSLIFSPNPQLRITASALVRVVEPDLGPAPPYVFRFSISTIF